ncbi:hypothetical protein Nepgr_013506 [Nepenthes gracilis]|uniref:Secreted protein n=1 Tax=Nepenthes gracilis TaxID=150966 RepID=A0AAD3SIZ4_NEPGR|nr:hypothetical protein Nepgr_013506 [Nepenthes gracilis]
MLVQICLPFVAAFGCCSAAGCVEFWPFAAGKKTALSPVEGQCSLHWLWNQLDPVLLLMHPDACIADVGVWCIAVGFCFYVKASFVLLLLCSTADDGAAGLGAGAFCCRALPCHCVNYHIQVQGSTGSRAEQQHTLDSSAAEQQPPACQNCCQTEKSQQFVSATPNSRQEQKLMHVITPARPESHHQQATST